MPKIVLLDPRDLSGEDLAKLQALYSRSDASVTEHMERLAAEGSAAFMERFYLGYGHASIADCATAPVFVEGVSHLVAKAVQDTPLYNGQECSTRYIDFKGRPAIGPAGPAAARILARWDRLYALVYDAVTAALLADRPGEPDRVARNAIHARACDVARGFLPLGSKTNLSWTTTFRQFGEHVAELVHHPLAEVRETAGQVLAELHGAAPGSFRLVDYPARADFYAGAGLALHYARLDECPMLAAAGRAEAGVLHEAWRDDALLARLPATLYRGRPPKTALPRPVAPAARFAFEAWIDYGSFRDLQRHRNGFCRIPLVEGPLDMHPWYLGRLPDAVRAEAEALVALQEREIAALATPAAAEGDPARLAELQYLYPLAQRVPVRLDYSLAQTVYVVEMRSGRDVHPTLRAVALAMADALAAAVPEVPFHADRREAEGLNLARGTQTFRKDVEGAPADAAA